MRGTGEYQQEIVFTDGMCATSVITYRPIFPHGWNFKYPYSRIEALTKLTTQSDIGFNPSDQKGE